MFHLKFIYGLIIFLLFTSNILSQQYLNLDFEQQTANGEPRVWFPMNPIHLQYYHVVIDTSAYYSGNKSLRVNHLSNTDMPIFAINRIITDDVIGKNVRLSGYIKTEEIVDGHAELWLFNLTDSAETFYEIEGWGPSGTTEWTHYSTELNVDSTAEKILFGIALKCSGGTAWFDNLQIEIDGIEYKQEQFIPTQDQVNWVIDNAISFNSVEPTSDYSDLFPLKTIIGDAKIVALGEATHGTSDFFKMKHKIVKFLAEEMDFTVFAFEDMIPECRNIGNFVLNGEGSPIKLLDKLYHVWDTQEVLNMILWMQEFNRSDNNNLEFWGFDMQYPFTSADSVKSFAVRADPTNSVSLINACNKVIANYRNNNFKVMKENAEYVYNHLLSNREMYLQSIDTLEVEWATKYAEIMVHSVELSSKHLVGEGSNYRDEKMALNVEWILEHFPPDTKIVLWAHNGHTSKNLFQRYWEDLNPMGSVLKRKYQDDFVSIGFGFHDGTYRASNNNHQSYQAFKAFPSTEGGVEWAFHKTNIPNLYLDLSKVSTNDTNSNWLNKYLEIHSLGWRAEEHQLLPVKLTDMFDLFIYIDETTAAHGDPVVNVVEQTNNKISKEYTLYQNYPNPFNPATIIQYSIPVAALSSVEVQNVSLKVYDILGREVATLVNQKQKPGSFEVTWDASNQPSGVYFYRLTVGASTLRQAQYNASSATNFVETKKMILIR